MGWEGDMNDSLVPCESQCYDGLVGLFFFGECGRCVPMGVYDPQKVRVSDMEGSERMTWCVWLVEGAG